MVDYGISPYFLQSVQHALCFVVHLLVHVTNFLIIFLPQLFEHPLRLIFQIDHPLYLIILLIHFLPKLKQPLINNKRRLLNFLINRLNKLGTNPRPRTLFNSLNSGTNLSINSIFNIFHLMFNLQFNFFNNIFHFIYFFLCL